MFKLTLIISLSIAFVVTELQSPKAAMGDPETVKSQRGQGVVLADPKRDECLEGVAKKSNQMHDKDLQADTRTTTARDPISG